MKVRFKILFLLGFLIHFSLAFPQQNKNTPIFDKAIKTQSNIYTNEPNFKKAQYFFLEKNWDSTLVYTMKQLSQTEENKEINNYCYFFRGVSFQEKKIFNESQKELLKVSKQFSFYHYVRMKLGEIALEQKEFQKAIQYFKEIEQSDAQKFSGIKKSSIKHNLALCYLHLEQYDKAEFYLIKSIELQEQQKDTILLIGYYGDIATYYYDQYKDQLAIPYFEKAYQLGKKSKDFDLKRKTSLNMAIIEENRKNPSRALAYRKEFDQWKDSLNDQNKIWEVAELEKQFAVKQKQKEVSLLKIENKIKIAERNGLLYSAIVLFLLLATSFYSYREKIKANKIISAQKQTLDELNATKDKLFSIVSHDLRSSVNALKNSNNRLLENLETNNLEKLNFLLHQNSTIVNGAYSLLDNLLHWALMQTKQLYFEITPMRLFHIVEQMAFNYRPLMLEKNILFKNTVLKSDLIYADQESLKIILRNFMDNAIKFSNPNGFIKIYTQNNNDTYCELVIEDNGIGMNEATRNNLLQETLLLSKKANEDIIGTGLGMQLCKTMIQKNNGKLAIESELGKGTKMIVSLSKTPPDA